MSSVVRRVNLFLFLFLSVLFLLLFRDQLFDQYNTPNTEEFLSSTQKARGNDAPDRIFLITLDTTRQDRLKTYGYKINTMPFLDQLARHGKVFRNAISVSATTGIVHASLFTGQLPFQHGVLVGYKTEPLLRYNNLLPQVLASMGYKTLAITSQDSQFFPGLSKAFEYIDKPSAPDDFPYRTAEDTTNRAIQALDAVDEQRVFFWLHFFDPHRPYRNDEYKKKKTYATRLEALKANYPNFEYFEEHMGVQLEELTKLYNAKAKQAKRIYLDESFAYDSELNYLDFHLMRFFAKTLSNRGERTDLWIVFSDHGEGLGNHGATRHAAKIYNEQLRKVMILHSNNTDLIKSGETDIPSHTTDIYPTLLDLVGADPDIIRSFHLNEQWEGQSLAEALGDGPRSGDPSRVLFSMRKRFDEHFVLPRDKGLHFRNMEHVAIQNTSFKYLRWEDGSEQLFHLTTDPYELTDLREEKPEILRLFRKKLASFLQSKNYAGQLLETLQKEVDRDGQPEH